MAHALVVTVPDPRGSHLDWTFDSAIESVRRAHERAGYALDRYWLPWSAGDSLTTRDEKGRALPAAVLVPGVMVFRRSHPLRDSVAVVWLVGETPTYGIYTRALHAALADRDMVRACWSSADRKATRPMSDTLRIVGPMVSGSARSLRDALEIWHGDSRKQPLTATKPLAEWGEHKKHEKKAARRPTRMAWVVSGGATAPQNAVTLRSCVDSVLRPATDGSALSARLPSADTLRLCRDSAWLRFSATANSVDVLRRVIEVLLVDRLGIRPSEIAYLSESGTAYGLAFAASDRSARRTPGRARRTPNQSKDSTASTGNDTAAAIGRKLDSQPLEIPFPMNISRLRKEYARLPAPTDTQPNGQPGWRTRLSWEDPASVSETPATLSDLSPAMIERTISDIEQTLLLHRIRAVGIVATDVRDRLFLASLIRERLHDVRVFLVGTNSLYLRPELNRDLLGSLVVASYPLFLESQFWDLTHNNDRQRLVFASDLGEGTYNATLAQLQLDSAMVDYSFPLRRDSIAKRSSPPVWITVVGRNSLLPVLVDDSIPTGDSANARLAYTFDRAKPPTRKDAEVISTTFFQVVATSTLLLAFAWAFYLHFRQTTKRVQENRDAGRADLGSNVQNPEATETANRPTDKQKQAELQKDWGIVLQSLRWHRHSWLVFRFAALVCAFAPLLLILFRPRAHGSPRAVGGFLFLVAAIFITSAWTFMEWVRGMRSRDAAIGSAPDRDRATGVWKRAGPHVLLLALAFLYVVTTGALVLQVAVRLDGAEAAMFFLRAMQLDSGVTPVVPLVVGGVLLVVWATWHLKRVALLGHMSAFEAACRQGAIDAAAVAPKCEVPERNDAPSRVEGYTPASAAPDPSALGSAVRLKDSVQKIRNGLLDAAPGRGAYILMSGFTLLTLTLLPQFNRSIEVAVLPTFGWVPTSFDLIVRFLIFAALALSVWGLYRMVIVWWRLRECLENIQALPLGGALDRLPKSVARLTRLTPFDAPSNLAVDLALDRAAQVKWVQLRTMQAVVPTPITTALPKPGASYYPLRSNGEPFDEGLVEPLVTIQSALCNAAQADAQVYLDGLVVKSDESDAEKPRTVATKPARRKRQSNPEPALPSNKWVPVIQDLVALYVVDYVEWVVRHLRGLALSLLLALSLTTILLSTYPFEPEGTVRGLFFALMGVTVVSMAVVLFQMNRNVVLSRITGTDVGQVTWDTKFVLNLALVGGIPLITVISAELPQVREFLFSWVTPVLKALGKG